MGVAPDKSGATRCFVIGGPPALDSSDTNLFGEMMPEKLLELTAEYIAVKDSDAWHLPGHQARTLQEIAAEYGAELKRFLAS